MNRRATFGWAVGSVLAVVTMVIGCGLNGWLPPDLSELSSAELKSEAWALLERCRTEPWYIGWASAIRHEEVHKQMIGRGLLYIATRSDTIYAAVNSDDDLQQSN